MSGGNFTKAPVQVGACLSKVITSYRDQSGNKTQGNYVGGGHPKIICAISKQAWMCPIEATENLHLIAEAFNVANETDLTPRQLLKQRDQLLDVLRQMTSHTGNVTADTAHDCIFLAGEAVAKVEGRS